MLCSWMWTANTCPISTSSSTAITIEQFTLSENGAQTSGVVVGPVSNSLYYLITIYYFGYSAVRKVDVSGSETWLAAFGSSPMMKSLSVDATEQYVYFVSSTSNFVVMKLTASNGIVVSQHQ